MACRASKPIHASASLALVTSYLHASPHTPAWWNEPNGGVMKAVAEVSEPWYTPWLMASRSMAMEMALRASTLLNGVRLSVTRRR